MPCGRPHLRHYTCWGHANASSSGGCSSVPTLTKFLETVWTSVSQAWVGSSCSMKTGCLLKWRWGLDTTWWRLPGWGVSVRVVHRGKKLWYKLVLNVDFHLIFRFVLCWYFCASIKKHFAYAVAQAPISFHIKRRGNYNGTGGVLLPREKEADALTLEGVKVIVASLLPHNK